MAKARLHPFCALSSYKQVLMGVGFDYRCRMALPKSRLAVAKTSPVPISRRIEIHPQRTTATWLAYAVPCGVPL
jgi:hypothetical protein